MREKRAIGEQFDVIGEKQPVGVQFRQGFDKFARFLKIAGRRQRQNIGGVMYAEGRVRCIKAGTCRLPLHVKIENADAHITDKRVAAKMRHCLQARHAEPEMVGRH